MRYARERKVHAQKKRRKERVGGGGREGEKERGNGREDKDVRCFLSSSSCTRPETSALPLFFQKTMSDGPAEGRAGCTIFSDFLFLERSSLLGASMARDRWENIAANSHPLERVRQFDRQTFCRQFRWRSSARETPDVPGDLNIFDEFSFPPTEIIVTQIVAKQLYGEDFGGSEWYYDAIILLLFFYAHVMACVNRPDDACEIDQRC